MNDDLLNDPTLQAHLQQEMEEVEDTAVLQAALRAYHNARIDGLCHEGAWECALEVLRLYQANKPPSP